MFVPPATVQNVADKFNATPCDSAGLLAISVEMSRRYKDDVAQLDAGTALYDALYRWARDGQNEGHSWPMERTS